MQHGHVVQVRVANQVIYYDDEADDRQDPRDMLNDQDCIAVKAGAGAIAAVKMTESDGNMEAALVIGIFPEGGATGLLGWLWKKVLKVEEQ